MKKILLTAISLMSIILYFLIPQNREWFNNRIVGYWNDFLRDRHRLGIEDRKTKRWGNSYTLSKQITEYVSTNGNARNAIVLVPPTSYFKERQLDYHVPEPSVFYYYTGLKTVWINSNLASTANWMVVAEKGKLKIIKVNDKSVISDSLAVFKRYPVAL